MGRFAALVISLLVFAQLSSSALDVKVSRALARQPGEVTRAIVVRSDPSRPGGLAFQRAEVTTAQAVKLAAKDDVVKVLPNIPIQVPPTPGPHLSWDDLSSQGLLSRPGAGSISPDTWFAKDIQGASLAWKSGYTGDGVRVAVMDEGIDFSHPDLAGCEARVTDPASPYYGWPMVFDPNAMAIYAAKGIATSGYADTTPTVSGPTAVVRGFTISLPGTSKSGVYHIGVHPNYWLPFIIGKWGAPAFVLVADENVAGVYDTVYVDLNKNYDFRDDKACRRGDELSWMDFDDDGLSDLSGGMIYFIADGVRPIPASDWLFHRAPPANGCLVAFAGSFGKDESHGTLVTSAIAAKGIVGSTYSLPQKPADSGGMVYGMAPGAKIIQIGNIYNYMADLYDALQFAVRGYDGVPGTSDDADIVNMSFGISSEDADGWDFLSRYIASLNQTVAPRTTFVAASGNGGPGYGTVNSPGGAHSVVTVGAATLYGSTDAFGSINSADQILWGDVQSWSDRGPSSLGQIKPDVVAIGAYATGDIPVYGSGEGAWATWGGTSLSAPITTGVLALVYQAYKTRHGVFPDYEEAKNLLMSGAKNLSFNVLEQGAGMIDANRSTKLAAGSGGCEISPPSWSAGGPKSSAAPGFPHILKAGQSANKTFTIQNTGSSVARVALSSRRLIYGGKREFTIPTASSIESFDASTSKPDYLVDLTNLVSSRVDLARIRISSPYQNLSLAGPASRFLGPSSLWMASLLDWKDQNGDGVYWRDADRNGAVNFGELQEPELNRFMIANPWSDTIEISVNHPRQRIHDALVLGLHHLKKDAAIPTTTFKVEVEFYREAAWNWAILPVANLVVLPGKKVNFPVRLQVPRNAKPGMYSGMIVATDGAGTEVNVPVSAVVATDGDDLDDQPWLISGADGFLDTYDNGRMFGAFDWGWREESGDWRFYYIDSPEQFTGMKSYTLANATWPDMPADTDIEILQPDTTDFFSASMPSVFGPYGMVISGRSRNTHTLAGMWPFETSTGGPSEWVAGEAGPGLNLVQLHNVLSSGKQGAEPFNLRAGNVGIDPAELVLTPGQTSASIRFRSGMHLPGLASLAYGFAAPQVLTKQLATPNPPQNPSSASWKKVIAVTGAGMLDVTTKSANAIDIDLYLLYDSNGDGQFDWTYEVVAVSASPGPNEHLRYLLPRDGSYMVAVHSFSVPKTSTFDISILTANGGDILASMPSGAITKNSQRTISLAFAPAPAGAQGILFLGPTEAPGIIPVPISVAGQ